MPGQTRSRRDGRVRAFREVCNGRSLRPDGHGPMFEDKSVTSPSSIANVTSASGDGKPEPGELKIKERRSWKTWQLLSAALIAAVFGMWINGDTGGGASNTTGTSSGSGKLPPPSASSSGSGAAGGTATTTTAAAAAGGTTTTTAAGGSTTTERWADPRRPPRWADPRRRRPRRRRPQQDLRESSSPRHSSRATGPARRSRRQRRHGTSAGHSDAPLPQPRDPRSRCS